VNLLDSLLDAIVRLDGDALVMHVGEKPYVVTTTEATQEFRGPLAWGQVELSSRVLTSDAVGGMLGQILPLDQRAALDEYGATEFEVAGARSSLERFTIVAARGGEDIWLEVRRHRQPEPEPEAAVEAAADIASVPVESAERAGDAVGTPPPIEAPTVAHEPVAAEPEFVAETASGEDVALPVPQTAAIEAREASDEFEPVVVAPEPVTAAPLAVEEDAEPAVAEPVLRDEVVENEPPAFAAESDREAVLIAAMQDWGDDVMTEGDLGELLRASAAAVITGGTGEAESLDWSTDDEDVIELGGEGDAASELITPEEQPAAQDITGPAAADLPAVPIAGASSAAAEDEINLEEELAASQPIEAATEAVKELSATFPDEAPQREEAPVVEEPFIELVAVDEPSTIAEAIAAEHPVTVHEPIAVVEPAVDEPAAAEPEHVVASAPEALEEEAVEVMEEPEADRAVSRPPAIVVPLPRQPKSDAAGARASAGTTLQRLLRLAAGHGAATVYVVAQTPPMIRVDGEFSALDGEAAMSAAFVERLLTEVLPATGDSASAPAESLIDVPDIGRVRCMTFRDHRGPGVIFRMVPPRAISADQLGLSAEVQALCSEADGLVLVSGSRGSGKSTLLTSFVDLINRTRSDHIITTESQIEFVHENKRSFISQREIRGDGDAFVTAVRAACREEPDVLIIEDMRTPEVVSLALEAAESGRLVFASVPGVSIASALERIVEMFPAERREKLQTSLAATLRGVVSQVLLRKLRGGRIAAREVLINNAAVASLILEGKTFQVPAAIENGRRAGMMSFAESLAALVREGVVHPSHAYRKAPNREQFLANLRRDGVDMSVTERLA
jgi:twitching motility protein PilT